jgi:transmembrane sensor
MSTSQRNKLNNQIYDQASEWFVEFRAGDVDSVDRRSFNAWLRTSPEHVRAYLELAAIWNEGSRLDPNHRFDEDELVEQALSEINVVSLDLAPQLRSPTSEAGGQSRAGPRGDEAPSAVVKGERRFGKAFALAASIAIVAVGMAAWSYLQRGTYSTDIGEQRSITLADGSNIELNARTKLRIEFTEHARNIELIQGQALFHVAKDKTRPFVVTSNGTRVRAVGTQFDVYRKKTGTTVTVVEGRVAVFPGEFRQTEPGLGAEEPSQRSTAARGEVLRESRGEAPRPEGSAPAKPESGIHANTGELLLAAGEQVIVTPRATVRPEKSNITAATAWTQHRLVFDSATLAEVADEFNRYNHRRLVIQSPELYDFHITGIFLSTDPGSLLRFLQARPGIVITERDDEILVSKKL